MGMLYAGTSGWAYPAWKPAFYPEKLAQAKFLSHYATRLNTVEVNYTFRAFPTEKMLTNWIESTPPEFLFSLKANQRITHFARLKNAGEVTAAFLDKLMPLISARRLGAVLFQLPPHLKADLPLLEAFLQDLPQTLRTAFEFRHPSWFTEATYELMRSKNVALCVAESEELETPDVLTADFCYYRLRKGEYSAAERSQIAEKLKKRVAEGRNVFSYLKHEDDPTGALIAEELLGKRLPG